VNRNAGQIALPMIEEIVQACSGKVDRDIDEEHSILRLIAGRRARPKPAFLRAGAC
jgi:hypothetical protein